MKLLLPGPEPRESNQTLWILAIGNLLLLVIARFLGPWLVTAKHQAVPFLTCFFRKITGHYCPFCGMTRAFTAAMHGDFARSFAENPMGLVLIISGLLLFFWQCLALIVKRHPAERVWHILGKTLFIMLLINWVYLFFAKV